MSLNHIIRETVPDDEKLDVKFGIVEATNMIITDSTFTNLTVTNNLNGHNVFANNNLVASISASVNNNLTVGDNIICSGKIDVNSAEPGGHVTCNNSSKSKVGLFKSKPYLNSTTIGTSQILAVDETVNGMLLFDDSSKTIFTYILPYANALDVYLGLSGTDEYAFRINCAIFATNSTGTYKLDSESVSGVSINFAGTFSKTLTHTIGSESNFSFISVRQSNGTYIVYG